MHVHACLLALHTGKPVKMVYNREESFFGHVHRHPATMRYEHGADPRRHAGLRQGRDLCSTAAPTRRSTPAVVGNAGTHGHRPVRRAERARSTATASTPTTRRAARCAASARCRPRSPTRRRWTSWPPARPGPGRAPRSRNAHGARAPPAPTGQVIDSPPRRSPSCCSGCRTMPLPPAAATTAAPTCASLPGGVSNTTHGEGVRRGVGYAVGLQERRLLRGLRRLLHRAGAAGGRRPASRSPPCTPPPPRSARGWSRSSSRSAGPSSASTRVVVHPKDTRVGSGGSTSASRQTYVTGGAVKAACEAVRARVLRPRGCPAGRARRRRCGWTPARSSADAGEVVIGAGRRCWATSAVEETVEWRHRPTEPIDPETGQGYAHVQYAFSAHRAVVDVDVDLGLVKVVELGTARRTSGRAINPQRRGRPDPGRQHPGHGPGADGGDRRPGRRDPEPVLHRLPHPHHPRHAADADRRCWSTPTRTRRTACGASGSRRRSPPDRPWRRRSARRAACRCARVPIRPEHITGT